MKTFKTSTRQKRQKRQKTCLRDHIEGLFNSLDKYIQQFFILFAIYLHKASLCSWQ